MVVELEVVGGDDGLTVVGVEVRLMIIKSSILGGWNQPSG
jgi:hypothetical protein